MPRTILVADDSPTHQRRANGILTGEGLAVVTVSNGVAAIKKLPSVKPSLVLADVSMPGRDGYEVCEFVKNAPDLAHVPVLLIFSDMEPYDEARARQVHADGRIKKPFGQDELVAVVKRFVTAAEEAPPPPPQPVVVAPPPAMVTEPVDLPSEPEAKTELPDLGTLSEGVAFTIPPVEETPPRTEVTPPLMAAAEELPAAIASLEQAAAAEFAPALEIPVPEEVPSPEPPAIAAVEEMPLAAEAPTLIEEVPASAEPMLVEESQQLVTAEETEFGERTMAFRLPVQIAEPVLTDDFGAPPAAVEAPPPLAEIAPPEVVEEATAGEAVATEPEAPIPFEVPPAAVETPPPLAAIAPPGEVREVALVEEIAKEQEAPAQIEAVPPAVEVPPLLAAIPPPEVVEEPAAIKEVAKEAEAPPPAEVTHPVEAETASVAAASEPVTAVAEALEAPPTTAPAEMAAAIEPSPPAVVAAEETPAPSASAPEPVPEETTATVATLDTDLVNWIVHNVVVRMAPPALTTAAVEDLIRQISDQMIAELTQPPPEPPG